MTMKRILYILIAAVTIGSLLFSCEAIEDRESLPAVTLTPETLKFSITQDATNKNLVNFKSDDPTVIPFWKYVDANGNELGHSNQSVDKVTFPFAGKYSIFYTAFARGGSVEAAPVTVDVPENDETFFKDPRWAKLTNGQAGKTWVLYMTAPLEFIGNTPGYINRAVSGPGWWPNLTDISWAGLENKDWGEITFDLNGGYNVSVTQTNPALGSTAKTTKKGTFNYSLTDGETNDRISFNGGAEMLHPNEPSYFLPSFSFTNVKIVELTDTSLCFIAIRADNDYLIYHLVPKS
ncbi:hypothetical protein SAMN06265220_102883 [Flavobacterium nitrogenifigens]|uniref:PKD domain-containing protein n=2 Tax=Flavobacterium nitrogenifigens TaxID=1617283 RepID=A0A521D0S6_9FLAO|nr:hypothetical protein DM397_10780 [Flavobacterium nitrogenifigens]SMO65307.1 hypothetical protein SAMN06265220_102883 [Flavobacterium nitrogenifigens]